MIVSIHQPDYIPYIGYFYKISCSDVFVFLDDAQFSNDNMHHWNRIKTPQGEHRLKIPVEYKFGDPITQVRTKDELNWKEKHLKTIQMNYMKAPAFREIFPMFRELLMAHYDNLAEMNIAINQWICTGFGLRPKYYRSSDMKLLTIKEQRVIDICLAVGGKTYISGNGARAYQIEQHFSDNGVTLQYTNYHPITYKQLWKEFIPNMSILDYLFIYGFNWNHIDEAV
ncbi:WbqC family protein [Sporomusa acidovorans]|uniref:WbqC-like protein family protein n=1 Tax=Sporomusa acidovorans (strain ATCC 49682 / DSM 3132 / Mol) TaxID=1123286 RepID=A0ABZ3IZ87_SPOA4|nr:WbqC family protein [Sporomusa acidovorans]OZC17237.1 WbqC-like protein family protein [Sporomusa acidovorans DSM 3132]SDF15394.1 WbqC-like protein family protein [Sporomusa acidovorans]